MRFQRCLHGKWSGSGFYYDQEISFSQYSLLKHIIFPLFSTYPVFAMGGNYTGSSGAYYSPGSTTSVTYAQVAPAGSTQSIIAANTYLIQPGVDGDAPPQTIIPPRSNPDAVNAVSTEKICQGNLLGDAYTRAHLRTTVQRYLTLPRINRLSSLSHT